MILEKIMYSGRLSNGINRYATNDSRDFAFLISAKQSCLTNSASVVRSSNDAVLNKRETKFYSTNQHQDRWSSSSIC